MQLLVEIDQNHNKPLYKKIADGIRRLIDDGTLRPGQVLPSTRDLAESMAVSRLTVRRSYEDLISQGYIRASHRGKTFVNTGLKIHEPIVPAESPEHVHLRLSQYGQRVSAVADHSVELANDICGAPLLTELPVARWRDCLQSAVRTVGSSLLSYDSDAFGYLPLREAIRALIARTRGVRCDVEQVVIFPTTQNGFDLMCHLMLDRGDCVAIEDPGFAGVHRSLESYGLALHGVPVDENGIRVDALKQIQQTPRLVYTTPSHQDPTGVPMSPERRRELLDWAAATGTLIVEDDFDCEYRYGEDPFPSLQSLDAADVVIYRYNFWKGMFPLVRLGFNVIPKQLVVPYRKAKQILQRDFSLIEQAALAEFIVGGHYERHLAQSHKVYAKRRAALIHAITMVFGKEAQIAKRTGGTHLLVQFSGRFSQARIVEAAAECHLPLTSTRMNYLHVAPRGNEFRISFATLEDREADSTIRRFRQMLID